MAALFGLSPRPKGTKKMILASSALAGVHAAEARMEKSARALARAGMPEDRVDLSAEMVALIEARNATALNVKVAQTGEEMERALLDALSGLHAE